jgi:hypothetical protein
MPTVVATAIMRAALQDILPVPTTSAAIHNQEAFAHSIYKSSFKRFASMFFFFFSARSLFRNKCLGTHAQVCALLKSDAIHMLFPRHSGPSKCGFQKTKILLLMVTTSIVSEADDEILKSCFISSDHAFSQIRGSYFSWFRTWMHFTALHCRSEELLLHSAPQLYACACISMCMHNQTIQVIFMHIPGYSQAIYTSDFHAYSCLCTSNLCIFRVYALQRGMHVCAYIMHLCAFIRMNH